MVLDDASVGDALKEALKTQEFEVFVARSIEERGSLLSEGPWDVVVSGLAGADELLAVVLTADLFSQVLFYDSGVSVKQAVDLMRAGAWSVFESGETSVEDLGAAVTEAWGERLADIRLAEEHGIE